MRLAEVTARDGAICVWCGAEPWPVDLSVEHLLPRTRRGRGLPENLTVACRRCNRRRGARSVVAYVRAQRQDGQAPRVDLLIGALTRLSGSLSPRHAEYGRRQLSLLQRELRAAA